jgi:hypothetical protein
MERACGMQHQEYPPQCFLSGKISSLGEISQKQRLENSDFRVFFIANIF